MFRRDALLKTSRKADFADLVPYSLDKRPRLRRPRMQRISRQADFAKASAVANLLAMRFWMRTGYGGQVRRRRSGPLQSRQRPRLRRPRTQRRKDKKEQGYRGFPPIGSSAVANRRIGLPQPLFTSGEGDIVKSCVQEEGASSVNNS